MKRIKQTCLPLLVLMATGCVGHWVDLHAWYDSITISPTTAPVYQALTGYKNKDTPLDNLKGFSHRMRPTLGEGSNVQEDKFAGTAQDEGGVTESWDSRNDTFPEMGGKYDTEIQDSSTGCEEFREILSKSQMELCEKFHDHMSPIIQGAKMGLNECRYQFRHHQWNCSALGLRDYGPRRMRMKVGAEYLLDGNNNVGTDSSLSELGHDGGRLLEIHQSSEEVVFRDGPGSSSKGGNLVDWDMLVAKGSREVAFAYAIWSAAVTQGIARACRDGSLESCTCGRTSRPRNLKREWQWGGCGDNMHYSYKFSQDFVDVIEMEKHVRGKREKAKILANLHNNEAGRRAVMKKAKVACKCHGISGSCALVTCWHQVPSLRTLGEHLMKRYSRASLVKIDRRGRLLTKRSLDSPPGVYDLVYVENSPNYCERDERLGIFGTQGRICNRTGIGASNCKVMCCNRGHRRKVMKTTARCNCKFVWCCQVLCDECSTLQKYDVCN